VFGGFILTVLGHGVWSLTRQWQTARGRSRLQIQYLGLGLCLFFCGGVTTNLIIPTLIPSTRAGMYGPYFSLFLVGLTAHAIIRHRLMDMRVVIRQSVTYGLSAGAAVGIIWGLFVATDRGQIPAILILSSPDDLCGGRHRLSSSSDHSPVSA
jgi:hypothetical protein